MKPKMKPEEVSKQIRKILQRNLEGINTFVFFIEGEKFDRKAIMGTKAGLPRNVFYLSGFMLACLLAEVPVNFHDKVLKDIIKGHQDAFIHGRGQLLPGWELKPSKASDPKEEEEEEPGSFYDEMEEPGYNS